MKHETGIDRAAPVFRSKVPGRLKDEDDSICRSHHAARVFPRRARGDIHDTQATLEN